MVKNNGSGDPDSTKGYPSKLYPLSILQVIVLLVLVAIADVFTIVQGYSVPSEIRPVTYFIFIILAMLAFFFVVKPGDTWSLGITLAIILGIIAIALVTVQDVVIEYKISSRTPIIIIGAIVAPLIAAYLYSLAKKRR